MIRLKPFEHFQPRDLSEAARLMQEVPQAMALAGGTDLLVRMKQGIVNPRALVNLKRIPELSGVTAGGEGLKIGALATAAELAADQALGAGYSALAEAASQLGAPGIRSLATIGGNLFRASPASDLVPALMALGARVITQGPAGQQVYQAGEICTGPGATCLLPGQLISAVQLPKHKANSSSTYLKFSRRKGLDLALAGVAMHLELDAGKKRIEKARIALSSVGPTPLRVSAAEDILCSGDWDEPLLMQAGQKAAEECQPIDDLRASASYRRELVAVLTVRAAEICLKRAGV